MPVVDRAKETEIVQKAQQRGWSQDQIKTAVLQFRGQAPAPTTPQIPQAAPQPEQKKGGFLADITQAPRQLLSQGAATVAGIGSAIKGATTGGEGLGKFSQEETNKLNEAVTKERFGTAAIGSQDTGLAQDIGKIVGTGLEVGSFAAPVGIGGTVAKTAAQTGVKAAVRPSLAALAKAGAVAGGVGQTGRELVDQKPLGGALGRIAGATGFGAALGPAARGVGKATSTLTKPITSSIAAGASKIPERLMNNILRPASKAFRFGRNPGRAVSELGIIANSQEELLSGIIQARSSIGQEIGDSIRSSSQLIKKRFDVNGVVKPLDDAIDKAIRSGEQGLVNRLEAVRDGLTQVFGKRQGKVMAVGSKKPKLSLEELWDVKKQLGEATKWTGQAFDNDVNQARASVFANIKAILEKNVDNPNFKKLNDQYGNLIEASSALENRMAVSQRNNLISLPDIGIAGTFGLATGGPGAVIGFALSRIGKTVAFKTRAAKLLNSVLEKMGPGEKALLDQLAPKIEPLLEEMGEEEITGLIRALPALIQVMRSSAFTPPEDNNQ